MTTPDQHDDLDARGGRQTDPQHTDPQHTDARYDDNRYDDTQRAGTRPGDEQHGGAPHGGPQPDTGYDTGETSTAADTRTADAGGDDRSGAHGRDGHATGTGAAAQGDPLERERLVPAQRAESYGSRWDAVKGTFVDEPRQAVAEADALVGELLEELEELFREQRRSIEQGLDADETSTEDLRLALRRYRSFFDRLLSL
jgi:hypothetical protein